MTRVVNSLFTSTQQLREFVVKRNPTGAAAEESGFDFRLPERQFFASEALERPDPSIIVDAS
jgi:hypothetical protein